MASSLPPTPPRLAPPRPARVLEAWAQAAAQGRVQRAVIIQFQQAGPRRLLRTHWAQGRTARLRVWLEPKAEARTAQPWPRAALRHWPRLATRGRLLVLTTPPALRKQVRWGPPGVGSPKLPEGQWPQHQFDSAQVARVVGCFSRTPVACGHPPYQFSDTHPSLAESQLWVHQQTFTEHLLRTSPVPVHHKDVPWAMFIRDMGTWTLKSWCSLGSRWVIGVSRNF